MPQTQREQCLTQFRTFISSNHKAIGLLVQWKIENKYMQRRMRFCRSRLSFSRVHIGVRIQGRNPFTSNHSLQELSQ